MSRMIRVPFIGFHYFKPMDYDSTTKLALIERLAGSLTTDRRTDIRVDQVRE